MVPPSWDFPSLVPLHPAFWDQWAGLYLDRHSPAGTLGKSHLVFAKVILHVPFVAFTVPSNIYAQRQHPKGFPGAHPGPTRNNSNSSWTAARPCSRHLAS